MRQKTAEALRRLGELTSATVRLATSVPIGEDGLVAGVTGTLDGHNAVDTGAARLPFPHARSHAARTLEAGSRRPHTPLSFFSSALSYHAGLVAAFKPLYDEASKVSADIATSKALLHVVGTEWDPYATSHSFPKEAYQVSLAERGWASSLCPHR